MIIPDNFNGAKFAQKYNLDPMKDFWSDGVNLICPSLPNLTDNDLLDCIGDTFPTEEKFPTPISAPVVKAGQYMESAEYFLLSPKPQDTKDKAIAKAVEISTMTRKGMGEMLLNALVAIVEMDKEIKELKGKIK